MDQDGTWHGGRPQPKQLCVRWGPSPLPKKTAESPAPIFGPCLGLLLPNGWMDQEVGLGPGHIVVDGDQAPLPQKEGGASQIFGPCL